MMTLSGTHGEGCIQKLGEDKRRSMSNTLITTNAGHGAGHGKKMQTRQKEQNNDTDVHTKKHSKKAIYNPYKKKPNTQNKPTSAEALIDGEGCVYNKQHADEESIISDKSIASRSCLFNDPFLHNKERARLILWDVNSTVGITDVIKSSLSTLKSSFGGTILIAERHQNKTTIMLVGVGAHDAALSLINYKAMNKPWKGCSQHNRECHCPNPLCCEEINIGASCQICHGKKPTGLEQSRTIWLENMVNVDKFVTRRKKSGQSMYGNEQLVVLPVSLMTTRFLLALPRKSSRC